MLTRIYIEALLVDEELADQLLLDPAGKCQFCHRGKWQFCRCLATLIHRTSEMPVFFRVLRPVIQPDRPETPISR